MGARGFAGFGRQATGPALCPCALRGFCQKIAVKGIIAFLEDCALPTIAPLGDMVRDAGKDDAGQARHGSRIMVFGYLAKCQRSSVPEKSE